MVCGVEKNVCSELNSIWKRVKERHKQMIVVFGPWKKYTENYSLLVQFLNFKFCVYLAWQVICISLNHLAHFVLSFSLCLWDWCCLGPSLVSPFWFDVVLTYQRVWLLCLICTNHRGTCWWQNSPAAIVITSNRISINAL